MCAISGMAGTGAGGSGVRCARIPISLILSDGSPHAPARDLLDRVGAGPDAHQRGPVGDDQHTVVEATSSKPAMISSTAGNTSISATSSAFCGTRPAPRAPAGDRQGDRHPLARQGVQLEGHLGVVAPPGPVEAQEEGVRADLRPGAVVGPAEQERLLAEGVGEAPPYRAGAGRSIVPTRSPATGRTRDAAEVVLMVQVAAEALGASARDSSSAWPRRAVAALQGVGGRRAGGVARRGPTPGEGRRPRRRRRPRGRWRGGRRVGSRSVSSWRVPTTVVSRLRRSGARGTSDTGRTLPYTRPRAGPAPGVPAAARIGVPIRCAGEAPPRALRSREKSRSPDDGRPTPLRGGARAGREGGGRCGGRRPRRAPIRRDPPLRPRRGAGRRPAARRPGRAARLSRRPASSPTRPWTPARARSPRSASSRPGRPGGGRPARRRLGGRAPGRPAPPPAPGHRRRGRRAARALRRRPAARAARPGRRAPPEQTRPR